MVEPSPKDSEKNQNTIAINLSGEQVKTLVGLVREEWSKIPAGPTGDRSPEGYARQNELTSLLKVLEQPLGQVSPKGE